MKKISLLLISILFCTMQLQAQDTLSVNCPDAEIQVFRLKAGYSTLFLNNTTACDSVTLLSGKKYQLIQRDIKACKSFVELYKFYRDQVKKGDQEVAVIVDGYENIIKTKDDAYDKLMNEYGTLNGLLNTSITQTGEAVDVSKKSLVTLEASLANISATNESLRGDIKDLKKLNTKNKLIFGAGGFVIGFLVGFIVAK